jgi:16S rRNA (guanine966-N2)-methyltransferase
MQVSAGRLKGRKLRYPRSGLRPTTGMTRQAMFNMCAAKLDGARVLDLFAGAGALGIEAISRGARSAVFVELSGPIFAFLRDNLRGLDGVEAMRGDVLRILGKLSGAGFDLAFADPPYRQGLVQETVDAVAAHDVLGPGGWLVMEHHRKEVPVAPAGWKVLKQSRHGDTAISILRRQE